MKTYVAMKVELKWRLIHLVTGLLIIQKLSVQKRVATAKVQSRPK